MDGYDLLVTAHVAGAVCWVGGNTYLQIAGKRIIDRHQPEEMQGFVGDIVWLGPRWFIPISLWTIAFGLAVVFDGPWSFSDPFVSAGLTMFVISFLIGAGYISPQTEKLEKIGESEGVDAPAYTEKLKNILLASRIELVLLWVIVALMVIKPG